MTLTRGSKFLLVSSVAALVVWVLAGSPSRSLAGALPQKAETTMQDCAALGRVLEMQPVRASVRHVSERGSLSVLWGCLPGHALPGLRRIKSAFRVGQYRRGDD